MATRTKKNLCNSCYRLVEDTFSTCPYCGFEIDTKKSSSEEVVTSKTYGFPGFLEWKAVESSNGAELQAKSSYFGLKRVTRYSAGMVNYGILPICLIVIIAELYLAFLWTSQAFDKSRSDLLSMGFISIGMALLTCYVTYTGYIRPFRDLKKQ